MILINTMFYILILHHSNKKGFVNNFHVTYFKRKSEPLQQRECLELKQEQAVETELQYRQSDQNFLSSYQLSWNKMGLK